MADIEYSIKDLERSVKLDGEIKNVEFSRLIAPGENYMSLVLKADFNVEKDGQSKIVSTVAKRLPFGEKKFIGVLATAMKYEIKFYNEIVPILRDFAKEQGIGELDFFPECLGSRYSLDPKKTEQEEADVDSFLLLENLITHGYKNEDRQKGFDLITSRAIVKNLALLHAVPLAIKFKKPDLFKVIKEYLKDSMLKNEDLEKFSLPSDTKGPNDLLLDIMINMPECSQYADRLKKLLKSPKGKFPWYQPAQEPWSTIVHADFWVNNIMIKPREGQEPLVKFVDFQARLYGSYAKDLLFLMLISVENDVARNYMDDLLKYYYEEFTSVLRKVKVDLELTFTAFLKELRRVATEMEFGHAVFFTLPVFGEKDGTVDPATQEYDLMKHMNSMIEKLSQLQKDKLVLVATEAGARNWI